MQKNIKITALMLMLVSPLAIATPMKEAILATKNKQYTDAIKTLNIIQALSAEKELLLGYNYNALKQPQRAIRHLNKAYQYGSRKKGLWLERGLAYYALKKYYSAINDFKEYKRLSAKDSPMVDEMIARAYVLSGHAEIATFYFDKVLQSKAASAKEKKTVQNMQKTLSKSAYFFSAKGNNKLSNFSATLSGGYNSNVLALGNNFALPSDISRQSSSYGELVLSGYNTLYQSEDSQVRFIYQFLGDIYENVSSLNLINPFLSLRYDKRLNDKTLFSINLANDEAWVGDNRFSSVFSVRPAMRYQLDNWNDLEVTYAYNEENYFTATLPQLNRDGFTHLFSVSDSVTTPGGYLSFKGGYSANWTNTKGNDFSFQGNEIFAGLQILLPKNLMLDGTYTYGLYHNDNLNSLTLPSGAPYKRRDNINRYHIELSHALTKQAVLYSRYEYIDDKANVPVYSYQQYIVSIGLNANWS